MHTDVQNAKKMQVQTTNAFNVYTVQIQYSNINQYVGTWRGHNSKITRDQRGQTQMLMHNINQHCPPGEDPSLTRHHDFMCSHMTSNSAKCTT